MQNLLDYKNTTEIQRVSPKMHRSIAALLLKKYEEMFQITPVTPNKIIHISKFQRWLTSVYNLNNYCLL